MNIKQLETSSKILKYKEKKADRDLKKITYKIKEIDKQKTENKQSFQEIRKKLLAGKKDAPLGSQKLLMNLLEKKKKNVGELRGNREELLTTLKAAKKKRSILEIKQGLVGKELKIQKTLKELPQIESVQEEFGVLKLRQNDELALEMESEEIVSQVAHEEAIQISKEVQVEGQNIGQTDSHVNQSFQDSFDQTAHQFQDSSHSGTGSESFGAHGSQQEQQEPPLHTFQELSERMKEFESWQNDSGSHLNCTYQLDSGKEVSLEVVKNNEGRMEITLVTTGDKSKFELSKSRFQLEKQLASAGFLGAQVKFKQINR